MPVLTKEEFLHTYSSFYEKFKPLLNIKKEDDYTLALELVEQLMSTMEDSIDDPNKPLLDLLADSIEHYEDSLEEIHEFNQEIEKMDPGRATLRLLIAQHNITHGELLEEIGSESLVSQIVNGDRNLTLEQITKLAKRFNISPQLFLGHD